MNNIELYVGALLSKYDETALEGLTNLAAHVAKDKAFAASFFAEAHAVNTLMGTFDRKCDMTPVFNNFGKMVKAVSGPPQVALVRALTNGVPFTRMVRQLEKVRDDNASAVAAALRLFNELFVASPHVTFRKFQKKVPLNLGVFDEGHSSYGLRRVREERTKLLLVFISATSAASGTSLSAATSEISATAVLQHGFLTKLMFDTPELYASGDLSSQKAVHEVLNAITDKFVTSTAISPARKRELLTSQRNILRTLIKGLAIPPLAAEIAVLLRKLTVAIAEPLFDYTVRRDDDDLRMPNHVLFSMLRRLNPRQRLVDSHLVVFMLNRCPELVRPYLSRIAMHLTQQDRSITDVASLTATANVLTRIFLLPLPLHIREKLIRLCPPAATASLYFDLTPATAADEIVPKWFNEFVHRMIVKSDNQMQLLFAIQVTEAAVRRAEALKDIITEMCNDPAAIGNNVPVDFDREAFDASFDAILKERLPQREEFWHRAVQQLLPASCSATGDIGSAKAQFVLQRLYLLMRSYTRLFSIRTSWASAIPAITNEWSAVAAPTSATFKLWVPSSVSSLCALLTTSMARGVTMPKLHHITFGGQSLKGEAALEAKRPPALLELVTWYCNERDRLENAADVEGDGNDDGAKVQSLHAQLWVLRLVLWVVHSVSVHFGVAIEEVSLWLEHLPAAAAPTFMHLMNAMLQQGLSKAADRIGEQLRNATHGSLAVSVDAFVQRTTAKFEEKQPTDPWQVDLKEQLPVFEKLSKKIKKQWENRDKLFNTKFGEVLAAQRGETESQRKVAAQQAKLERLTAQATAVAGAGSFAHVSPLKQLENFFNKKAAPPAVASANPATQQTIEDSLHALSSSTEKYGDDAKKLAKHVAKVVAIQFTNEESLSPWLQHDALLWKLAETLLFKSEEGKKASISAEASELQQTVAGAVLNNIVLIESGEAFASLLKRLRSSTETGAAATESTLLLVLLSALQIAYRYDLSLAADEINTMTTTLVSQYQGTLLQRDRMVFACLVALDSMRSTEDLVGGNNHGDDDSDVISLDSDASEVISLGSGSDDELPDKRKKDEKGASAKKKKVLKKKAPKRSAHQRRHVSARYSKPVRCLPCLQDNRFVVGGIAVAPNITVEADVLAQLAESWTLGDISVHSLRLPPSAFSTLLLTKPFYTNVDDETEESQKTSAMKSPVALVWEQIFPDAPSASDRNVCNLHQACNTSPDPRYLLPLIMSVAAARTHQRDGAAVGSEVVAASTLTQFFPYVLRGLSANAKSVVNLCKDIISLMYPVLSPIDRTIANYVRLHMAPQQRGESEGGFKNRRLRISSSVTAFLVHCVHLLREDKHSLHDIAVSTFENPQLVVADGQFPMGKLLFSFPTSCITSTQMFEQHHELQKQTKFADEAALAAAMGKAPPHLAFILRQLHYSCGSKKDAAALRKNGAIRTLMMLIGLLPSSLPLRRAAFSCLVNIVRTSTSVMSALAADIVPWCFSHLLQLTMEDDVRNSAEYLLEVLELLDSLYHHYRPSSASAIYRQHHQQLLTLQATMGRLRIVSVELPLVLKSLLSQTTSKVQSKALPAGLDLLATAPTKKRSRAGAKKEQ